MNFNPFNKNLNDIVESDLNTLLEVSEGWFIEYKEIIPKATAVAKSVSAFANSEGGLLFYGVKEGEDNKAGAFPGIAKAKGSDIQQKIRDAIASNLDRTPYYEYYIIKSESSGIIPEGNIVIMIYVPRSNNTPHIHSCGKIYIRKGDRSDPEPINNRGALFRLIERATKSENKFKKFIQISNYLYGDDINTPTVILYFIPHLFDSGRYVESIGFENYSKIMSSISNEISSTSLNNSFPTSEGYISKQLSDFNNPSNYFTWIHYHDGRSVVILPLRSYVINEGSQEVNKPYKYYSEFTKRAIEKGCDDYELVDLNIIFGLLSSSLYKQNQLLNNRTSLDSLWVKAKLINFDGKIPFIDSDTFISQIDEQGFPVIQSNNIITPSGLFKESTLEIEIKTEMKKEDYWYSVVAPWYQICNASGIHVPPDPEKLVELILSATRGIEAYSGK